MSRIRKTSLPFRWNTVNVTFTQGTANTVNLATFVQNQQNRTLTYSVIGTLPTGVSLAGAVVSYNGVGAAAASTVQFRITDGTHTAESAQTTVAIAVAQTSNTAPTWKANTPTSLGMFTAGVGGTFDFSQHGFDAEGDPIFYYRTGGTTDTAPGTVTVGETTGLGTIPGSLAAGSYSVAVRLAGSAEEADWQTRATGANVVWAHNFENATEVSAFVDTDSSTITHSVDGFAGGGSVSIDYPSNLHASVSALTATSASVVTVTISNVVNASYAPTAGQPVMFTGLTGQWATFNGYPDGTDGNYRFWTVTEVVSPTQYRISTTPDTNDGNTSAVNATGFSAPVLTSAKVQRALRANGAWYRPYSAISSPGNGKASNDIGITNGVSPARTWDHTATGSSRAGRVYRWRTDWYGHANYQSTLNSFPDWTGAAQSGAYRGSDFWLQVRVKIEGNRYQLGGASIRNPSYKMLAPAFGPSSPGHKVMWEDPNIYPTSPYTRPMSYGHYTRTAGGDTALQKKNASNQWIHQPGTSWPNSLVDSWAPESDYFHIDTNEWICWLFHIIPGITQSNSNWPNPPVGSAASESTGVQAWVATQTRIAAGLGYQNFMDCTGANGFPFVYETDVLNGNGPGFNLAWLCGYTNNVPAVYGFTKKFTQVIFKKGNGGTNPETDGIACPLA
jgi:hypothetical protein